MNPHVDSAWLQQARQQGLLPDDCSAAEAGRPWPVQLLTALGAWLAVIPLLFFLSLVFGSAWHAGVTAYIVGASLLVMSLSLLRSPVVSEFLEQLALPLLLLGVCSLGYALARDLPYRGALLADLLICSGLVLSLPRHWLRLILGMVAAGLAIGLLPGGESGRRDETSFWLSLHVALLVWAVAQGLIHQQGLRAGGAVRAALLEPVLRGWALGLLLALILLSGASFMVAGALGAGLARELGNASTGRWLQSILLVPAGCSGLATLAAAAVLVQAWPALRSWRLLVPVALLFGLALVLPGLGASLLILALALIRGWRTLTFGAAATALWVLGSFYYRLDLSLANKALVLVAAGALLGLWLWLGRERSTAPARWGRPSGAALWAIPLTALLSLAGINALIWQKEQLIAQGRPVLVSLAPADPRSLVQGDFMRLNYQLPTLPPVAEIAGPWQRRPRVALRLDERGVASEAHLLGPGEAAALDWQVVELSPVNGRWTLVSDAWFFEEGQEARLRTAAYGEFRVSGDGRALLVGLRDSQLRRLP